jgi:hypothetical protein
MMAGNMPAATGQLSVETGTARVTRRQFAFGQILTFAEEAQPIEAKQVKPQEETVAKPADEKIAREACVGRLVRVEGVLRDPQTGAQLANVEFEVYDDGKHVATQFIHHRFQLRNWQDLITFSLYFIAFNSATYPQDAFLHSFQFMPHRFILCSEDA